MLSELAAIVPCKNEELSVAKVIEDLRSIGLSLILIGLDPGSTDRTAEIAEALGANVVRATSGGYDGPVLACIAELERTGFEGSVLFLDGGNKYVVDSIRELLSAADPRADMTFGVRDAHLFWHQKLGNLLFASVLFLRYRKWVTDVSSVRLIPMPVLRRLHYEDREFSLPFQTVVHGLALEMDMRYFPIQCTPKRTGVSKVSGSKRNSMKAARQMFVALLKKPNFD